MIHIHDGDDLYSSLVGSMNGVSILFLFLLFCVLFYFMRTLWHEWVILNSVWWEREEKKKRLHIISMLDMDKVWCKSGEHFVKPQTNCNVVACMCVDIHYCMTFKFYNNSIITEQFTENLILLNAYAVCTCTKVCMYTKIICATELN